VLADAELPGGHEQRDFIGDGLCQLAGTHVGSSRIVRLVGARRYFTRRAKETFPPPFLHIDPAKKPIAGPKWIDFRINVDF
jgi:hypothetical protein